MKILGIFLCLMSLLILYKKLVFALFGKKTVGTIIGYGEKIKGTKGICSYNYKVEYEYESKKYIAMSLESVSTSSNSIPTKNLHRNVKISFFKNRKDLVSILDLSGIFFIGLFFFLLGVISIII